MVDKMLRMAGRGEDGNAKAMQIKNGQLKTTDSSGYIKSNASIVIPVGGTYVFTQNNESLFEKKDDYFLFVELMETASIRIRVEEFNVSDEGNHTLHTSMGKTIQGRGISQSDYIKISTNGARIRVFNEDTKDITIKHIFIKSVDLPNGFIKTMKALVVPSNNHLVLLDRADDLRGYRTVEITCVFENEFLNRIQLDEYIGTIVIRHGDNIGTLDSRSQFNDVFDLAGDSAQIRLFNSSEVDQVVHAVMIRGIY